MRPKTARGRELFERSLVQTHYQEEFTAKGNKPDILDLDKLREEADDDNNDEEHSVSLITLRTSPLDKPYLPSLPGGG